MPQRRTTPPVRRKHFDRAITFAAAAVAVLVVIGSARAGDDVFSATTAITLPAPQKITSFDISFVDQTLNMYLLADRTNKVVDVVDTGSNTLIAQLSANPPFAGVQPSNDDAGPDGVITVGHREAWVGDGPSQVKVIDLVSQQTTHVISTGGAHRADELCLDPRDGVVLVANDAETPFPFVSFISTQTYAVTGKITMDGTVAPGGRMASPKATNGIEQCQWSQRTGLFYLNIPEVNGPGNDTQPGAVVVISPQTQQIDAVFFIPIASCAGPQGMALGPAHQILLGCNNPNKTVPSTVIIDDRNGNVLGVVANEDGADEVYFNEAGENYFLARSGGASPQQLGIIDAQGNGNKKGGFSTDQSVMVGLPNTSSSPHGTAHSVAADPMMKQTFMPIPSTAGGTICSSAGGTDAMGCIAVFTPSHGNNGQGGNGQGGNGQGHGQGGNPQH